MLSSEKIVLALCILSIVFLSTNLMFLPLLRGRRNGRGANSSKAVQGLLSRPHSRDAQAMEELSQRVTQFKGEEGEADEPGGQKPEL
jgi:hypothetical protein